MKIKKLSQKQLEVLLFLEDLGPQIPGTPIASEFHDLLGVNRRTVGILVRYDLLETDSDQDDCFALSWRGLGYLRALRECGKLESRDSDNITPTPSVRSNPDQVPRKTRRRMAKCVDCETQRKVMAKEWLRAASPRCYVCGGRVEPSKFAHEEQIKHRDERDDRMFRRRQQKNAPDYAAEMITDHPRPGKSLGIVLTDDIPEGYAEEKIDGKEERPE